MSGVSGFRKAAALLAGGGVFTSGTYMLYHGTRMERAFEEKQKDKPSGFSFVQNPCRNEQYEHVAACYDDAIGTDEFYTGINLLRRSLLRFNARGTVCEVGAGTARNLDYYPLAVKRVLLTDSSEKMLSQAKEKLQKRRDTDPIRFAVLQADSAALDLPDNSFDTVVDTFGLCSYDDPVEVLREMARVCKPHGRILLLEHGRSKNWDFITKHLDKHAEQHSANWGCVWNRDLDALLEASELRVEVLRKFHFGTTYYIVCRPPRLSN